MEKRNKPIPKQAVSKTVNRANQIKRDDNVQNFDMGLYQIDETIKYYFDNVIMPQVPDSQGNMVQVPTMYGSPQRWKSAQKSGFMRDKNGRLQIPLVLEGIFTDFCGSPEMRNATGFPTFCRVVIRHRFIVKNLVVF